ncbi:MMPL family transporter [Lysinibacillus parviboronicapiens]|uniref:MMPL family transporter n=1 Tax=Lysinibacillus parviboronicapiens TaxID=436516 RepID=UPI000D338CDA|nr:MMPL family transporter [Lysinibacillus parviboronicapiens]
MKKFAEKKRWLAILFTWLLVMIVLSAVAPGAKEVTSPSKNAGLPDDALSIQAQQMVKNYYPASQGLPLFVVLHDEQGFDNATIKEYMTKVEAVMATSNYDLAVVPLSQMPEQAWTSFVAEDKTTFFMPIVFPEGNETKAVKKELDILKEKTAEAIPTVDAFFTGPTGIVADTYEMFSKADIVLILGTVAVILVLLIVIYRSPLLSLIPLIGAGITYVIVDKVLGLMGKAEVFPIDSQALSIMMILLFAVITDYSLLIFARFREELEKGLTTNEAMKNAVKFVTEPIVFSGSTVMLGMLTLFFAVYESYRIFAPVFAVPVLIILVAGLTLVPALFAIAGDKAFWPFNPRKRKVNVEKEGFWHRVARVVTNKPLLAMVPVLVILLIFTYQVKHITYTFNLLNSFPSEMSSVQGFKQLEKAFSPGEIAPTTAIIDAKADLTEAQITDIMSALEKQEGIEKVTAQGHVIAEKDASIVKLNVILDENPYSESAYDHIEQIRAHADTILAHAKIEGDLHVAGETAQQADIRAVSQGDEWRVAVIMTILITVMLGIQTRSLLAPLYMMATILLSFGAALGIMVFFFQDLLGYTGVSYRIPLYTFVFIVALGVDYSIMLMSRIREEKRHLPIKEAVLEGVGKTGSVISSAGLLLAATFAVLMTQPVMELRAFGFAVFVGVLVDTFLVRPIIIPAIIVLLGKWSFWPKKLNE